MGCMKCGMEIPEGQVFCEECLLEMEKYPVNPATPVLLPNRSNQNVVHKRSRRKIRKPEELISSLKNAVTALCVVCFLLIAALVLSVLMNLQLLGNKNINILPGQDYNVNETIGMPFADNQP